MDYRTAGYFSGGLSVGSITRREGVSSSLDGSQSADDSILVRWLKKALRLRRTPPEIKRVIDEGEEQGLIDEDEGDMIEGVFDLKQTVAREIMIPRTHLVCLPKEADLEQTLTKIISSGYSRIPVYNENVDQIIGVLNAKDLLPLWLKHQEDFNLADICREPFFVPETKRINDLLNELRSRKSHLAIIVDEYGGTAGIVTVEDIVEEIVGEICDEHDVEEVLFSGQEDGSVLVSARVTLYDFEEYFGVALPEGDYDTLGGYIILVMGKVPAKGEETEYQDLTMTVDGCDRKRITRVRVWRRLVADEKDRGDTPESSP
jgi:magnesium and cobalt transporter